MTGFRLMSICDDTVKEGEEEGERGGRGGRVGGGGTAVFD